VRICLFLVLAVLAVFGQTARFGFVGFDDNDYIYENPVVQQGLTWSGALWAFTYGKIGHWHPLTWLTHEMDVQFYGLWAGGHHVTNVALHAVTVVLLFWVLRTMTGAVWRSAFVAAVFAVHPLRAESVAWISERKDVLSGMFFVLTLWAYERYVRKPSDVRYAVVAVFFGLGLLSKNMLVTTPFVLLLLDWWPLKRFGDPPISPGNANLPRVSFWGLVKEKIPLLFLSALGCVATFLVPEKIDSAGRIPFLERAGNAVVSYGIYLRQMVWPMGLAAPYPFPEGGWPVVDVCVAAAVLIGITVLVIAARQRHPYLLLGWLWFLGMLLPAIGLVQISYYSHADRYTYLPEIGLAIAGTWAVADWTAEWRNRRVVLGGAMAAVVGALMVGGFLQTTYWRDAETLSRRALACTTNNPIAENNLALSLVNKGEVDEAITEYRQALKIQPDNATVLNNLGTALLQAGKPDEARTQFEAALKINPAQPAVEVNLGGVLEAKGQTEEAIMHYKKALEIDANYAQGHAVLGMALANEGREAEAIAEYRKALAIQPNLLGVINALGRALLRTGDFDGALANFDKTVGLSGGPLERWITLGIIFTEQKRWVEAVACYRHATEIDKHSAEAWVGLAQAFYQSGNAHEATNAARQALAIAREQNDAALIDVLQENISLYEAGRPAGMGK
jgi:protein O-mannosyl-transferase